MRRSYCEIISIRLIQYIFFCLKMITYNVKMITYNFNIITFYSFKIISYNFKTITYDLKVINWRNELLYKSVTVKQFHTKRAVSSHILFQIQIFRFLILLHIFICHSLYAFEFCSTQLIYHFILSTYFSYFRNEVFSLLLKLVINCTCIWWR